MLTRDQILATELKTVEIECPEWGGTVRLQELTADVAISLHNEMKKTKDAGEDSYRGLREIAIVHCAVGDDGERLFTPEDIAELRKKSNKVINRLGEAAWDLVGLDDAAVQESAEN